MNIIGTLNQQRVLKEHVTLIEEAGCNCIEYVLPKTSSSKDITTKFSTELYIDFTTLFALGGDDIAVKTINKSCIFYRIELFCMKSLK